MQNKELLSHLQKLMSQLSQIQSLQQSLASANPQTTPTPTTNTTSPPPQTTPTSDSNLAPSVSKSPLPEAEDPPLAMPAMTSTPTTPPKLGGGGGTDEVVTHSDMSLGLDFNLPTSTASNDPFQPLTSS